MFFFLILINRKNTGNRLATERGKVITYKGRIEKRSVLNLLIFPGGIFFSVFFFLFFLDFPAFFPLEEECDASGPDFVPSVIFPDLGNVSRFSCFARGGGFSRKRGKSGKYLPYRYVYR